MPTYLIERNIPGAHEMTPEQVHAGANKSCAALDRLGSDDIRWRESFVTKDRITCVYEARDEEVIREHARLSGFPAHEIREIAGTMDPTSAQPRT